MPRSFPYFCLFPADILMGIAWNATYPWKMQGEPFIDAEASSCIRTLRLKVRSEAYAWLNAAAIEVNQAWNFANETSARAARPFVGPPRWLMSFETDCWDTHEAMLSAEPGFVLLDVRGPTLFKKEHVPGAINLPHGKIVPSKMTAFRRETLSARTVRALSAMAPRAARLNWLALVLRSRSWRAVSPDGWTKVSSWRAA